MSKWLGFMFILMLSSQVLAHGEDKGISGQVARADWLDRLPLALVCIFVVIAVDGLFIVPIIRKLRAGKGIATGEVR